MKRTLIAIAAALGLASSASAATLSVNTDQQTYLVSDTITVTMTLDVDGTEAGFASAFGEISWDGVVGVGAGSSDQTGGSTNGGFLTSFGGGLSWFEGPNVCLSSSQCALIDQLQGTTTFAPDAGQTIVGTLLIHAAAVGTLDLVVEAGSFIMFGLTAGEVSFTTNAANANVVPEPGTAAMVGLGLLGLASVGRRRS
jgi:hypothetical protein